MACKFVHVAADWFLKKREKKCASRDLVSTLGRGAARGHARTTRGAHPRAGSWRARARGLGVRTPSRRGRHLARRPRRPRGPIFGGVPRITRKRENEKAQTHVPRGQTYMPTHLKLTCQLISHLQLISNSSRTHVKLTSNSSQTHLKLTCEMVNGFRKNVISNKLK